MTIKGAQIICSWSLKNHFLRQKSIIQSYQIRERKEIQDEDSYSTY
jgi:hypothetical protein